MSSGSVTVHADSTVQVLAEEAVTMDMLDLAVSTPVPRGRAAPCRPRADPGSRAPSWRGFDAHFSLVGWLSQELPGAAESPDRGLCPHPTLPHHSLIGIKGSELLSEVSPGCGERKPHSR